MLSMTGFGSAQAALGDASLHVELRSVNHRYLELRVKSPPELQDLGAIAEQFLRKRFTRGRFDLSIRVEKSSSSQFFDRERAREAYLALSQLREELAPTTELPITAIFSLPELFSSSTKLDRKQAQQSLERALSDAEQCLTEMQKTEGDNLRQLFLQYLSEARALRELILSKVQNTAPAYMEKLRERMIRLLEPLNIELDPQRLYQEAASFADRIDTTEEVARLESHYQQFEELLAQTEPVGRRLDFLIQEMGRETNTIGSKCQDTEVAHLVVELKSVLEKMREQVQNVQ